MKKVTLEITDTGWTTTVSIGERVFRERHIQTPDGTVCTEGDFDTDPIPEELKESLLSFFPQFIMKSLKSV